MKKTVLILMGMLFAFMVSGQTLIHTDTLTTGDNELMLLKWYHEKFMDEDGATSGEFTLLSLIGLQKEYITQDSTYTSVMTHYKRSLTHTDSLKNPYGENYFQAAFVKDYIYTTGESMKRTLSLYHVLNEPLRILE